MLFSNSPVKKVVEKLNPFSQKNKVSRLKFERKSDYRTFLKFIKDNTKEIEDIDISGEDKKRKGFMLGGALLGLGLLGRGDDDDGEGPRKIGEVKNLNDVLRKVKADKQRITPADRNRKSVSDVSRSIKVFKKRKVIVNPPETKRLRKGTRTIVKKYGKKKIVSPLTVRTPVTTGVGDSPSGSGNRRNIYDITSKESKNIKEITKPKKGEIAKQQRILRNFNKSQITEPTRISDQNFKNLKNLISGNFDSDELDNLIKIQRGYNEEGMQVVGNKEIPDSVKKEIERIQKRLSRKSLNNETRLRLEKRLNDIKKSAGVGDSTSVNQSKAKIDKNKFFQAPEIPSNKTKKLNTFDKVTNFSNRVLNSPVGKFTTFASGLLANPKLEIIKQLFTATPLADGTLKGKPGVIPAAEELMFNKDTAVNIFDFSEGRKSAIPFDANIKEPLVSQPSNLQAPINNIFVDFEFNTTEDLFFMKMGGS